LTIEEENKKEETRGGVSIDKKKPDNNKKKKQTRLWGRRGDARGTNGGGVFRRSLTLLLKKGTGECVCCV
jgi:hypothetical protein